MKKNFDLKKFNIFFLYSCKNNEFKKIKKISINNEYTKYLFFSSSNNIESKNIDIINQKDEFSIFLVHFEIEMDLIEKIKNEENKKEIILQYDNINFKYILNEKYFNEKDLTIFLFNIHFFNDDKNQKNIIPPSYLNLSLKDEILYLMIYFKNNELSNFFYNILYKFCTEINLYFEIIEYLLKIKDYQHLNLLLQKSIFNKNNCKYTNITNIEEIINNLTNKQTFLNLRLEAEKNYLNNEIKEGVNDFYNQYYHIIFFYYFEIDNLKVLEYINENLNQPFFKETLEQYHELLFSNKKQINTTMYSDKNHKFVIFIENFNENLFIKLNTINVFPTKIFELNATLEEIQLINDFMIFKNINNIIDFLYLSFIKKNFVLIEETNFLILIIFLNNKQQLFQINEKERSTTEIYKEISNKFEDMKKNFNHEINILRNENEENIKNLKKEYENKIKKIKRDYDDQIERLNKKIKNLEYNYNKIAK